MKRKNLALSILALFSVFLISGCSGTDGQKNVKAEIKEAFKNLYAVSSASFQVDLKGEMKEADGKQSGFDLKIDGASDMHDVKTPKLNLKVNGTGAAEGKEQGFDGEVRLDKENVYFLVSKFPDLGELVPAEMVKPFIGKWWKMPIPEGTFDKTSLPTGNEEELTEEQKKIRKLLEDTDFFKDLTYVGEENGNNHYKGTLNKKALKNFVFEVEKIQGNTMSESDKKAFEEGLEEVQVDADLWVDANEEILTKVSGKVTDLKAENGTDSLDFTMSFGNFNKKVEIEEPKEAEEFNPLMLLGQPTP